jgi:hypothetical protein
MTVRRNQGTGMFTSDLVAGNFYTAAEAAAAEASGADAVNHSAGDATGHDTGASGFGTIEGDAMALTPEDRQRMQDGIAKRNAAMGVDASGNQLPAYGTPMAAGGTATGFEVTSQPTVGTGTNSVSVAQLGPSGEPLVGGYQARNVHTTTGAGYDGTPASITQGEINPDVGGAMSGAGNGSALLGQTNDQTQLLRDDLAAKQTEQDALGVEAIDGARNMNPLVNRNLTQTAGNQARSALGPAATVEQSLADRGLGGFQDAQTSSRAVLDKLMNGPSTAARIGSQTLRNQLALARSASGGPGAVQEAMRQAQFAAPELQAQATQSAVQEDLQKTQAAGQVAIQQGQNALGARGQDIDVAKSNQAAGMRLTDNIAQLTGQQLNINQQNQELLGRMFTDMSKQQFDWSKLSADAQQAELERWAKVYGIDQTVMAQLKVAALANPEKGFLDYALPVIGGLTSLATAL